jgi:hypothetical protein
VIPFVLARLEVLTPRSAEEAMGALKQLLAEGIELGDRGYHLFGIRRGRYFSMSLGAPVLGGGGPVLRAWLQEGSVPTRFDVMVGARIEVLVLAAFWAFITVVGVVTQLFLQLAAVAAGRAGVRAVLELLPAFAVMAGILVVGHLMFRLRAGRDARLLLGAFRGALGGDGPDEAAPAPLH